jgi:hypothetical protein
MTLKLSLLLLLYCIALYYIILYYVILNKARGMILLWHSWKKQLGKMSGDKMEMVV